MLAIYLVLASVLCAAHPAAASVDLVQLSLEELMDLEVFSASKKNEPFFAVPAAIYVLTGDDIRRSGATSIPDALRGVPGIEVARIDGSKWGVAVRGFNDIFSDKLLVMVDGRTVYSPLFSGVFWETQEIALGNVERIEVVRGPGGALWGANAVNGIINIITKSAEETQGPAVWLGAGSENRTRLSARYGIPLGEKLYGALRLHYALRDELTRAGMGAADGWAIARAGFRIDGSLAAGDEIFFDANIYSGNIDQPFTFSDDPPYFENLDATTPIEGGHALLRWTHTQSADSEFALQAYVDYEQRDEVLINGDLQIYDIDIQHRWRSNDRQEIVWGGGYRLHRDNFSKSVITKFSPGKRSYGVLSAFAQNEVTLSPTQVKLIIGAKLEHNDFTGYAFQPSVRMAWTPDERQTLWAAASRAVRAPARADHDLRITAAVIPAEEGPDIFITTFGDERFEAEEAQTLELGYRARWRDNALFDATAFYTLYDNLRTSEPELPYPDPQNPESRIVVPVFFANRMEATTRGIEIALDLRPIPAWRLRAAYSYMNLDIELNKNSSYTAGLLWEGISPEQRFSLRSSHDLPGSIALDMGARYVDDIPGAFTKSYIGMDARLSIPLAEGIEIELLGHDLLYADRAEFRAPHGPTRPANVQRGFLVSLRWVPHF
jgi:iron complex outermembrane recepter protein